MRVFIDTNILVSAALGFGVPYKAYVKAVTSPNQGIVCDLVIDELRRTFNRKFPDKIARMEQFLAMALTLIEIVPTPEIADKDDRLRDTNDTPILQAAINAKANIIITGDKDFLESNVLTPTIMTAADFLGAQ